MSETDDNGSGDLTMDDDAIDEFLRERGDGVLSFAREGAGYGVPISFGYDGDRLFVHLVRFGAESEKLAFADASERVCLTTYATETRFEWKSVLVRGTLSPVPDEDVEYMEAVMDRNAWKPRLPDEDVESVRRMELLIDETTGRRSESRFTRDR